MKTQIFHLGNYDDLLSARDQIGWSKAPRILIVFPRKKRIHFTLTDYVLLAREANRNGAAAAFVLRNSDLRAHLEQMGLLCFGSVNEANRSKWWIGRRMKILDADILPIQRESKGKLLGGRIHSQAGRDLHPITRIIIFVFAIAAIVSLVAILIPRTRVTLAAERWEQQYSFTLQGDTTRATTPFSGIIHIYPLEFTLEDEIRIPASGQTTIADDYASGFVTLNNLTNRTLSIPAGLVVQASLDEPVLFKTCQNATLMAGHGEMQTVPIIAVLPGETGNVPAGAINAIKGEGDLSVNLENSQATGGGTNVTVASPSQYDLQLARKLLFEQLDATAKAKALTLLKPGQVLVNNSLAREETLQEQIEPEMGQPGEELYLLVQAQYTGWYMREEDLARISTVMLDALLPDGYEPMDNSLEFIFSGSLRKNENGFVQNVEISRTIESIIVPEDVISQIMGQNAGMATGIMKEQLNLAQTSEVETSPGWWPFLPFFRFQYEIIEK